MGTIYYCACLDCKKLVDLDKFYMVPGDVTHIDIEDHVKYYEGCTTYNRHCIFLMVFLDKHNGHRIAFGNSDALDECAGDWYDSYKRELEVYT